MCEEQLKYRLQKPQETVPLRQIIKIKKNKRNQDLISKV